MKKEKLKARIKEQKEIIARLNFALDQPSEVKPKMRGQLLVLDFPDYPGNGTSMRFRQLVVDGLRDIEEGKLPVEYAESCRQEIDECMKLVRDFKKRMAKSRRKSPILPS